MGDLLRVKRGQKANLPALMQGEPGFCLDEERLYIGGTNGNVPMPNKKEFDALVVNALFPPYGLTPCTGLGVVDETAAIQAMIDYVSTNGGGKVYFPKGTYRVANYLYFKDNVILEGAHRTKSILSCDIQVAGNGYFAKNAMLNTNYDIATTYNIGLKNLAIKGNATIEALLYFHNVDGLYIEDCYVYHTAIALKNMIQVIICRNVRIINNKFENLHIINIFDGSKDVVFAHNRCLNLYDSCVSIGSASIDSSMTVYNVVVADNTLEKRSGQDIGFCVDVFGRVKNVTVTGNTCVGGKHDNIIVQPDGGLAYYPEAVTISGNICTNAGRHGINVNHVSIARVTVTGNVVLDPVLAGIALACSHSVATGNTIRDAQIGIDLSYGMNTQADANNLYNCQWGIFLSTGASENIVISNNLVKTCDMDGIVVYNIDGQGTSFVNITGNMVDDCGNSNDGTYKHGIHVVLLDHAIIANNIVKNCTGNGIRAGNGSNYVAIVGNVGSGNSDNTFFSDGAQSIKQNNIEG
jgi:hypothetical protein